MNQLSILTTDRAASSRMQRFNPIRYLTPAVLVQYLEQFWSGYLRSFALLAEAIRNKDDVLKAVVRKRVASVARHRVEVLIGDDVDDDDMEAAKEQQEVLAWAYAHLDIEDAYDMNWRGGCQRLVEKLMDAQAYGYSAIETVYEPTEDGLKVHCKSVPLYWFENTTGKLRYLPQDGFYSGQELQDGAWIVAAGEALMEASAILYMTKRLAMNDWHTYTQAHAEPGMQAKTDAAIGSDAWVDLKTFVAGFGANSRVLTSLGTEFAKIDWSASGPLPYEQLIALANKGYATLWRGADLSTISGSQGPGQGASLQGSESDILEENDCAWVSEQLEPISKTILEWEFGTGVEVLAYAKVVMPPKKNVEADVKVDEFLLSKGVKLAVNDLLERYGRRAPKEDEEVVGGTQEDQGTEEELGEDGQPVNGKPRNGKADLDALFGAAGENGENGEVEDEEEAAANAFFGHGGRPGVRGGSAPSGEGGGTSASEIRSARAKGSYVPATAEKQRQGIKNEAMVAKEIGGNNLSDNEPADVVTGSHAVEVKTIVAGKNPKITMHPESLERKVRYAKRNKLKPMTVVIDNRGGKKDIYVNKGFGSFRLSSMTKVSTMAQLKEAFA